MADSPERELAAWLATLTEEAGDTLHAVRSTILPEPTRAGDDAERARGAIAALVAAQLVPGPVIGTGGMGVVRLAEQGSLGRPVAVKTLREDRRDPGAVLDLLAEARATGALEHPNIVPVHDLRLDATGRPMLVLKRIEGTAWSDLVGDAARVYARFGAELLDWNLGILMTVLNALRFAHSRGVLHRDVKPSNVMIGEFGEVYLLDWGIAVALRDDAPAGLPRARDATMLAGTPGYMAPEMLGGAGASLSERTDVYLAGAVLFEILAGHPPHEGDTIHAIIASIAASAPRLPLHAPPELARICLRALSADPAARPASVVELQHELQAYLAHRGSERLAATAHDRLVALGQAIAAPTGGELARQREDVARLLGACRFGFQEALAAWPHNEGARRGLVSATAMVAEAELAAGDPASALRLLSDLDEPPPELVARARAAAEARARRDAELAHLGEQHDRQIGARTRVVVTGALGTVFTIGPLVEQYLKQTTGVVRDHTHWLLWSVGVLVLVLGLAVWGRHSLSRTIVNRRMVATIALVFVSQLIYFGGAMIQGVPIAANEVGSMFVWFVFAAMAGLGIDRVLVPTAIAYGLGFLAASAWPEQRFYFMSASSLVFTINAIVAWRPGRVMTPR